VETNIAPPLPATESISARYRELDAWNPATILEALWEAQLAAVAAVRAALPAIEAAAAASVPLLARGGRLVYSGAGTSGRIGVQDGAELPPTFDWPRHRLVLLIAGGEAALTDSIENAEDDADAAMAAIARHAIGCDDVVLGIAASGTTPFTVAAVREAARRGALTIGIANSPGSPLLAAAAHPIAVATGAEAIAGSTRMQAGTAQKVVLNLFSTLVMVRLGRVHQGLMVDMQATNEKLRGRAVRLLRHLTGRDEAAVRAGLEQSGGRVKIAVLVLEGLDPAAAEALLQRNDGRLRAALADLRK
jgi:N-acetylmuramic acid 6-phosphate etherase